MNRTVVGRAVLVVIPMVGILIGGFITGRATADQPHMQAALEALKIADRELKEATADKGGHRVRAAKFVQEAIQETEKGIEFDRKH